MLVYPVRRWTSKQTMRNGEKRQGRGRSRKRDRATKVNEMQSKQTNWKDRKKLSFEQAAIQKPYYSCFILHLVFMLTDAMVYFIVVCV